MVRPDSSYMGHRSQLVIVMNPQPQRLSIRDSKKSEPGVDLHRVEVWCGLAICQEEQTLLRSFVFLLKALNHIHAEMNDAHHPKKGMLQRGSGGQGY